MAITQEMFRFVSARQPQHAPRRRLDRRLVRDLRRPGPGSLLVRLYGPGPFGPKLAAAQAYARGPEFVAATDPLVLALEPAVDVLRRELAPGVVLADVRAAYEAELAPVAPLLGRAPADELLGATTELLGRLWDSLYAQVTLGLDRYVSTNHLADALRVYAVLRLWWAHAATGRAIWTGGAFDDYELIVDLDAAESAGREADPIDPTTPTPAPGGGTGPGPGRPVPSGSAGAGPSVRVPLEVGATAPPAVGDLLLVEQELRRYELGELADVQSIMQGERRERTSRTLSRVSQTTTTETSSEQEETSSLSTDERFQLSSQAQRTASESFAVQTGVSVSGKFGPVQVGATVNASYSTGSSATETTAQEYAKTVTEEATKRVRTSFTQTSSLTVLTERQDTTLQGFNNEAGTGHVTGLYRWLDKIYTARLLNYGRRLLFTLDVPEPSAFLHGHLQRDAAAVLAGLVEPVPPAGVDPRTGEPLPAGSTEPGLTSFVDVTEDNYAALTGRYGVTVPLPPAAEITVARAYSHPEAMEATQLKSHTDADNELSYVSADNTLTVDPDYEMATLGVFTGTGDRERWWLEALKLGENNDVNRLLVTIGDESFGMSVTGQGGKGSTVDSDFNELRTLHPSEPVPNIRSGALPVTTVKDFEGIDAFTIVYTARRRPEALDAWKQQVWVAVVAAYDRARQAYEQALSAAQATAAARTELQTAQLREDEYRAIERTELKRGCIDLLTEGTAAGHPSISVAADGTPTIHADPAAAAAAGVQGWRAPLPNGSVSQFFELAWDWDQCVYTFHPYYWAGVERWSALSGATSPDPVFASFLRSGSATVVVPVRPGYERSVVLFRRTGQIWKGGYLPLFDTAEMLDVYADVELGLQLDPPEPVGEPWEVRLPTSLVMLQEDSTLPDFPPPAPVDPTTPDPEVDPPGARAPF